MERIESHDRDHWGRLRHDDDRVLRPSPGSRPPPVTRRDRGPHGAAPLRLTMSFLLMCFLKILFLQKLLSELIDT